VASPDRTNSTLSVRIHAGAPNGNIRIVSVYVAVDL
jgi:hypothetical protein